MEVVIEIPWLLYNLFKTVFEMSPKKYIFETLKYVVVSFIIVVVSTVVVNLLPNTGTMHFNCMCIS